LLVYFVIELPQFSMKKNEVTKLEKTTIVSIVYNFIFKTRFLYLLGGIGILVFIASMWNRYIYIDDAFFGEQAYFLAKVGLVKTPSLIDFLGCDIQLFSYHKLNIFVGAALIKIFGWSVTPLRLSTLIFFCLLMFMLWRYIKTNAPEFAPRHYLVAAFFLFFNPLILLYAYTYRPEIWVAFFGFCSFFFINSSLKSSGILRVVLAACFAGLAFLTHLNGLIFPVVGFIMLLLARKFREVLIFSAVATAVCALYIWDLWQVGHLQAWLFQLKNWPDNNATSYLSNGGLSLIKNVVMKLLSEHQRFFWSSKVWGISLLFITSLAFNFKYLLKEYRTLVIYTLILILVLNVAGSQIAERFLIYHFPFMAIIIAIGIIRIIEKGSNGLRAVYLVLLLAQIGFFAQMAIDIFKRNDNYQQKHRVIASKIPDNKQLVLVPYQFVFNLLDSYRLATFKGFEYYEKKIGREITQPELFRRADSLGIGYIVLPKEGLRYENTSIHCIDGREVEPSDIYKVIFEDSNAMILGRIEK